MVRSRVAITLLLFFAFCLTSCQKADDTIQYPQFDGDMAWEEDALKLESAFLDVYANELLNLYDTFMDSEYIGLQIGEYTNGWHYQVTTRTVDAVYNQMVNLDEISICDEISAFIERFHCTYIRWG